ncbi:MAG: DUF5696 domain-containing protein [Candidatus Omnitrophica bacterium]|nr:DUF5696 domain-containing protein [Candidatus Omnitrophota bacterium]MCM8828945.1 DUF5696 domain-containing protein [Candidatus Omnitrophota bacterium]
MNQEKIILKNDFLKAEIDKKDLTLSVFDLRTGIKWLMQKNGPGDIGVEGHAGPLIGLPFSSAGSIECRKGVNFIEIWLTKFPYRPNVWGTIDFAVNLVLELKKDTLSITVKTKNGRGEVSLIDSYYPRGFLFPEKSDGFLVLPYGHGCLLNKKFPYELDHTLPVYAQLGFVMPWWGQITDIGCGLIALPETPEDMGIRLITENGFGHTAHPYWQASLGNFSYPRKISYKFFERCDVVLLARTYRKFAEKRGLAKTLKEKAKERKNVEKLKGSIILSIWHESWFGNFRKKDVWKRMSFAEGLKRFKSFVRDVPVEKAVVHVDGWGRKGYDCLHPDILPPDPMLGGWEGLTKMANEIQAMGHIFLLHDNYVDLYADSSAFKPEFTIIDLSGIRPENNEWLGGRQSWLCPKQTMRFAKRNLTEVRKKINPSGTYLDCFTASHVRECYNQKHISSKKDTIKYWSRIFAMCQSFGWVTSSEGGADWAIPVLDFCHTVPPGICPFDLKQKINGPLGIPIPLYSLVWHDCIVIPVWISQKKEGNSFLWGILWGGIPSIRPRSLECNSAPYNKDDIAFVRRIMPMAKLSEKILFEKMTDFKLLDIKGNIQQTEFSDGTLIIVDFEKKQYQIKTG